MVLVKRCEQGNFCRFPGKYDHQARQVLPPSAVAIGKNRLQHAVLVHEAGILPISALNMLNQPIFQKIHHFHR